jgi:hypothetical protein
VKKHRVASLKPSVVGRFFGSVRRSWIRMTSLPLRPKNAIFGRYWNYRDERENKIIGYDLGVGRVVIMDLKTWRETVP